MIVSFIQDGARSQLSFNCSKFHLLFGELLLSFRSSVGEASPNLGEVFDPSYVSS